MDTRNPCTGHSAGARKSTAADNSSPSGIGPQTQREPFVVVIAPAIWKGCDVLVEPPTITHRPRHFGDHAAALTFAEELARVEGWPVRDRTAD
jgi:hypothetical protein